MKITLFWDDFSYTFLISLGQMKKLPLSSADGESYITRRENGGA